MVKQTYDYDLLVIGAGAGVAQPIGGVITSTLLLWLASLCVLGITLVYSVLIPSSIAAGILGFFTIYYLSFAPLVLHRQIPSIPVRMARLRSPAPT